MIVPAISGPCLLRRCTMGRCFFLDSPASWALVYEQNLEVTAVFHSLLEQGEGNEVIIPTPNWPNMKWAVVLAGGGRDFLELYASLRSMDGDIGN